MIFEVWERSNFICHEKKRNERNASELTDRRRYCWFRSNYDFNSTMKTVSIICLINIQTMTGRRQRGKWDDDIKLTMKTPILWYPKLSQNLADVHTRPSYYHFIFIVNSVLLWLGSGSFSHVYVRLMMNWRIFDWW